jgi:hypothetical protein
MKTKDLFLESKDAKIIDTFPSYNIRWVCNDGHINFDVIISKGSQHTICLKCGKHYTYFIE